MKKIVVAKPKEGLVLFVKRLMVKFSAKKEPVYGSFDGACVEVLAQNKVKICAYENETILDYIKRVVSISNMCQVGVSAMHSGVKFVVSKTMNMQEALRSFNRTRDGIVSAGR